MPHTIDETADFETTLSLPAFAATERLSVDDWRSRAEDTTTSLRHVGDAHVGDATLESPAMTAEMTLFDEPLPLPPPLEGEPVYLVEVQERGTTRLLAARSTLEDAVRVAGGVHPAIADVTIRELPLPCDAETLARAMASLRTWTRTPDGCWSPDLKALPTAAHAADE
jgi:hypothetical protein